MSYTQLTQDERYRIQQHYRHQTITQIAQTLGLHKSTISREIKLHSQNQVYRAASAQQQNWEADTIIGKDQKSALLTLVERVTRYTIICKLKNFKAEDTANAVIRVLKAHKDWVHTITMDNGKEFYRHKKIADGLKAETYFCRPYRSWEKGTNENTNGLIHRYFPKQTDFRKIIRKAIRQVQDELNHWPRKTLGCETPSVLFLNIFQPLLTDVALENRK
ncbi:IS30 family transposase [Neisseria lisongii]|uniref:IS30 family transposase n=1 Tax=Neisseria lisongii TaxID=2912188 RepID=A0AAW5AQZ6_9NEIS|nr:IS30 family transposase [Neisseria lisongii]MCF7529838.1 IS30 family transposase [Neisseria lisongii]